MFRLFKKKFHRWFSFTIASLVNWISVPEDVLGADFALALCWEISQVPSLLVPCDEKHYGLKDWLGHLSVFMSFLLHSQRPLHGSLYFLFINLSLLLTSFSSIDLASPLCWSKSLAAFQPTKSLSTLLPTSKQRHGELSEVFQAEEGAWEKVKCHSRVQGQGS